MTQPIYHHKFRPWRVVGYQRIVAAESTWKKPITWDKAAACLRTFDCANGDHADCCAQKSRPRVFCASLADVFEGWGGECHDASGCAHYTHDARPDDMIRNWQLCGATSDGYHYTTLDDVRARLFATIDATPTLDWLLLTKRPENIRRMLPRVDCVVYRDGGDGLRTTDIDGEDRAGALRQYRSNVWLGVSISCQDDADRRIPELLKCRDLCAKTFVMRDTEMEIV